MKCAKPQRSQRARVAATLALFAVGCTDPSFREPERDAAVGPSTVKGGRTSGRDGASADEGDASLGAQGVGARDSGRLGSTTPVIEVMRDGSTPAAAHVDASQSAPSMALPDWASKLPGQYAAHAEGFNQDSAGATSRLDEIALVTIERQAETMTLRIQTCLQSALNTLALLRVDHPEVLAVRTHSVVFDEGERFHTVPIPQASGYSREVPAACAKKEGQTIPKDPAQVWISGANCRCPASAESPVPLDDCRVQDPDGDKQPGYRLTLTGVGNGVALGTATVHGVTDHRSHFVDGRIRADGSLYAQEELADVNTQLACMPAGCTDITGLSTACPPSYNSAQFVPLAARAEGWDCKSIAAMSDKLFPAAPTPFPGNCL